MLKGLNDLSITTLKMLHGDRVIKVGSEIENDIRRRYSVLLNDVKDKSLADKEDARKCWKTYSTLKKFLNDAGKVPFRLMLAQEIDNLEIPEIKERFLQRLCVTDIADERKNFKRFMDLIENEKNIEIFNENGYFLYNIHDENGVTAYMQACLEANTKLINNLSKSSDNYYVGERDNFGRTAVHYAIDSKDLVTFETVISDRNFTAKYANKATLDTYPLYIIQNVKEEKAKVMLNTLFNKINEEELKKDLLEHQNINGDTILSLSLKQNYREVAEELVEKYGADINAVDKEGNTMLMQQIKLENHANIKFLLKHGADANLVNSENVNAKDLAKQSTNKKIRKIFKEWEKQEAKKAKEQQAEEEKQAAKEKLAVNDKILTENKESLKTKTTITQEVSAQAAISVFEIASDSDRLLRKKSTGSKKNPSLTTNPNIESKTKPAKSETSQAFGGARPKVKKEKTTNFQPQAKKIESDLERIKRLEQQSKEEEKTRRLEVRQKQALEQEAAQQRQKDELLTTSNLEQSQVTQKALETINQKRLTIAKNIDERIYLVKRDESKDHEGRPAIVIASVCDEKGDKKFLVALSTSQDTWQKKAPEIKEDSKPLVITLDANKDEKKSYFYQTTWIDEQEKKKYWTTSVKLSVQDREKLSASISKQDLDKITKEREKQQTLESKKSTKTTMIMT